MSISSITPNTALPQTWQNVFQQRRQDFSQLTEALQNNDLQGAQQAFSDLQALQSNSQSSTNTNTNSNSSGNPIANDWTALGNALQSGKLTQAQNDFKQLQNDIQTAFQNQSGTQGTNRAHHGHHHHHHAEASSTQDSSTTDSTTGSGTGSANNNSGGGLSIIA